MNWVLNVKCPTQTHVVEHSVPRWGQRLKRDLARESVGGVAKVPLPACSLLPDLGCNVTSCLKLPLSAMVYPWACLPFLM